MEKRFISGSYNQWFDNQSTNEAKYANSIVFIKNQNDSTKGDMIFAQGAYFEMNNTADVENIIKNFLDGKGAGNIKVVVDKNGNLTISETSIASLTGKSESTELVQAKAVAGALTTPVSLVLSADEAASVFTFTETFKKLDGSEDEVVTAVFKEGSHIDLTQDGGLKISHATITQATDKKTSETLSADDKVFTTNIYDIDNYGHVTGKTVHSVTLPDTAFSDTTYSAGTGLTLAEGNVFNHTNTVVKNSETKSDVTLSSDVKTFDFDQYSYDTEGHITGKVTNVVTLPNTAFSDTTYTFTGGGATEVQTEGTAITISSVNTTYTGENAIVVTEPEEDSTQGKVTLKIDESEKVLTQSASGLKTNLVIDYVSSTNKIRLTNGTDVISEFDASAFVKDSFLKNVEIATSNESGVAGNYLKFTFETVDNDGTGDPEDSTKVIYVDIKDFYVKTTVSDDAATYSSVVKTGDDYKVSNVLGTISRNNTSNVTTVSKDGLATVADIKTVLETIDSDLDAVKATSADENEIAVVTGVTQVDGKITAVDSGLAATKAYVDGKFGEVKHNTVSAPKAEGEENYATVTSETNADGSTNYKVVVSGVDDAITAATTTGTVVNQGTNGTYNFVKTKDGLMTATDIAALMNEAWEWGTIQ